MIGALWDQFRPVGPSHSEYPPTPTADQAHDLMREHIMCSALVCRSKGLAMRVLVEAGRITPDLTRGPEWGM